MTDRRHRLFVGEELGGDPLQNSAFEIVTHATRPMPTAEQQSVEMICN